MSARAVCSHSLRRRKITSCSRLTDMVGSPRPPFPSAPSEPSLRRLGISGPGNNDRPIKAQLIVALVALIILLAVPLYLWRRPAIHSMIVDAGVARVAASVSAPPVVSAPPPPVPFQPPRVRTSPIQRVRCGPSRLRASSGVTCDALPALEHAFVEAIQQTLDCAPRTAKEGTINHVLEVDFTRKKLHVFPGKSGDWHGPSARRTTKCIERALGKPDFAAMAHTHAYYALAVMTSYPAAGGAGHLAGNEIAAVPPAPGISSFGISPGAAGISSSTAPVGN
jgi:hypothetical protein